jgi:NAD(P)-dependent dehydrogenase (short-subunit alcohol dehydrogenase family)
VTGAASGIGQGIAQGIASVGAYVIVADIKESVAQNTAGKIVNDGGRSEAYTLDVRKSDQFKSMVEYLMRQYGRIDILVNNAGINRRKLLADTSEKGVVLKIKPLLEKAGISRGSSISPAIGGITP